MRIKEALKPVPSSLVCSATLSLSPLNTSHITSIFSSLGIFLISMPVPPLCPAPPLLCVLHLVPQLTKLLLLLYWDWTTAWQQKGKRVALCHFLSRQSFQIHLNCCLPMEMQQPFYGRNGRISSRTSWQKNVPSTAGGRAHAAEEQFCTDGVKTLMSGLTVFSWKTKGLIF